MGLFSNSLPASTQPAHLDRLVTIQTPTETRDAIGQSVPTFATLAEVYAAWVPTSGQEVQAAKQLQPLIIGILRIRYLSGVTTGCRVVMGSVTFELVGPPIEVGRQHYLDLNLRSLTTAAP